MLTTDTNDASKKKKKLLSYLWKESLIKTDEQQVEMPAAPEMRPDLFMSLIDPISKERLAYIRIKQDSKDLGHSNPKWYKLNSVKPGQQLTSFLLASVQLLTEAEARKTQRPNIKRNLKVQYIFKACLYAAYDLQSSDGQNLDPIMCQAAIYIGGREFQLEQSECKVGRNPIWNKVFFDGNVQMDDKLEFASNIVVVFKNLEAKGLWGFDF